ncbi:MAG: hypothetical protein IPI49_33390 [Myxococcales bacterium]|nr:hypothetical protein [Myxococcales bacterium]
MRSSGLLASDGMADVHGAAGAAPLVLQRDSTAAAPKVASSTLETVSQPRGPGAPLTLLACRRLWPP